MLLYAAGRARWPVGALPVRGQPAGQVGSTQCLRGRGHEGGELPHLSTDSGSCINLTVEIALADPREEILEVLSRFRRRGNDDFPIHHRKVYISLIPPVKLTRFRGEPSLRIVCCCRLPPSALLFFLSSSRAPRVVGSRVGSAAKALSQATPGCISDRQE